MPGCWTQVSVHIQTLNPPSSHSDYAPITGHSSYLLYGAGQLALAYQATVLQWGYTFPEASTSSTGPAGTSEIMCVTNVDTNSPMDQFVLLINSKVKGTAFVSYSFTESLWNLFFFHAQKPNCCNLQWLGEKSELLESKWITWNAQNRHTKTKMPMFCFLTSSMGIKSHPCLVCSNAKLITWNVQVRHSAISFLMGILQLFHLNDLRS